jgi:general secretion pathway protein K
MIVIADTHFLVNNSHPKYVRGVALLQVLLISTVIALLAIRFSHTAQDQVQMAGQIQTKVQAQLAAYSAYSEVVFLELSDSIVTESKNDLRWSDLLKKKQKINFYGAPVVWSDAVTIEVQDLNGLLPQLFPQHFLWRKLLENRAVPEVDIERYFGVWKDIQDADNDVWYLGGDEPLSLPNGASYLNGYAQNDKILRWIFSDRPELLVDLLAFSDVDASYDTNFTHCPTTLLNVLFEPPVAKAIEVLRSHRRVSLSELSVLLPEGFAANNLSFTRSNTFRLSTRVSINGVNWQESRTIRLNVDSQPPFKHLLYN